MENNRQTNPSLAPRAGGMVESNNEAESNRKRRIDYDLKRKFYEKNLLDGLGPTLFPLPVLRAQAINRRINRPALPRFF